MRLCVYTFALELGIARNNQLAEIEITRGKAHPAHHHNPSSIDVNPQQA